MPTSKQQILTAIRRIRPPEVDLPTLDRPWTEYADRRQQFAQMIEAVGAVVIAVRSRSELNDQLLGLLAYTAARDIASLVPGVGRPNVDLDDVATPHDLANLDIAILPGEFAVAENGAVWVTDQRVPHRVVYFLAQHLVLVVPAGEIVDNMHAAYERLASHGPRDAAAIHSRPILGREPRFGAFISGPSKTADIEQSLVIGAHGPRSLTVCLLEE
jgi:L-lactate dehydrogenase complex protein LldG